MISIFNIQNISTLVICALLGGQEAMAWCPTPSDYTINCAGCTVQLTCDVYNLQGIVIQGSDVTFDGQGYSIYNSTGNAVGVFSSGYSTVKNLYIYNSAVSGVFATSTPGDYLSVQNVTANGGNSGVAHYYTGTLSIYDGSFSGNAFGVYAGYGSPTGGYADSYNTITAGNTQWGSYRDSKPWSFLTYEHSTHNLNHGAFIQNSPRSEIKYGYFGYNANGSSNGLRLENSSDSKIIGNSGGSNASYDCITVSSSNITRSGNSWGSSSGYCN